MTDRNRPDPRPDGAAHPSDAEVLRLLLEAAQQHEEAMRIADFCDEHDTEIAVPMKYAWNNPIGLVVRNDPIGLVVEERPRGYMV